MQPIIRNIFSNWTALGVNVLISFFLAPFVVKSLGNTYYGIWVILMQFTGYLYLLDFGIRESIIRYVSRLTADDGVEDPNEILSAGLVLYAGIGVICLLVTGLLAITFPLIFKVDSETVTTARFVVILAGFTIAQALVSNVFVGVLMGLQRYDVFNKISIGIAFIRLTLILFFLGSGYGIIALGIIQLLVGLGASILVYCSAKQLLHDTGAEFKFARRSIAQRKPIIKTLYHYSIHVVINNVGQKAIYYTDALVIGVLAGPATVTFYAIAGNLIEYLRRLLLVSNNVLNPAASELESRGNAAGIKNLLIQGTRFSMLLSLPICIVYLTMGSEFISLWMGREYSEISGGVLFVLATGVLLTSPQNTIGNILYGTSRHKLISNLRIVEATLNLALSIILFPYLGIVGVALGTTIPQLLIMGILLPGIVLKRLHLPYLGFITSAYVRPLIAATPFAISCLFVNTYFPAMSLLTFGLQILAIGPVYIVGVWYIGLTTSERLKYRKLGLGLRKSTV